jgi:diphosphoinositol-polyphosphate diphosphatase
MISGSTHETGSEPLPVPRQVAVAVAYRLKTADDRIPQVEYLLVSSRKHLGSWVLPKGGVEKEELSDHGLAALREAWEEGIEFFTDSLFRSCTPVFRHLPTFPVFACFDDLICGWIEGGIRGKLVDRLHRSSDPKAHRAIQKIKIFIPRAEYSFWLIKVEEGEAGVSSSWPEEHERERRWVRREEAIDLVQWRQDGAVDALMKVDEDLLLDQY